MLKGFTANPPNRCYLCKYELFSKIKEVAGKHRIQYIAEGSNIDDLGDYRPGCRQSRNWELSARLKMPV